MVLTAVVIGWLSLVPGVAAEQPATAAGTSVGPHFSDFPVARLYRGPTADPKFKNRSEEEFLGPLLRGAGSAPNFAGQFRLVQFRIGDGPIGAVVVEVKTGSVFHLPHEVVCDDFFIRDTNCLSRYRGMQRPEEQSDSAPLSFQVGSELLIINRCRVAGSAVTAVERSYYRLHGWKWRLLKRASLAPPPVF
jgi:hypothetical protein